MNGVGSVIDIGVPPLGESVTEATVLRWAKHSGDAVSRDELVVELETDKIMVEVVSPVAGVLEITANEGETVLTGAVLGRVTASTAEETSGRHVASETPLPLSDSCTSADPAPSPASSSPAVAPLPSTKRAAGVGVRRPPPAQARRTNSPVTVTSAVRASRSTPAPAARSAERETRVRMTRLRQTIAQRLKQAQSTAAMLTTFNEVDMSTVTTLRNHYKNDFEKTHGVKLGIMSFFVRACVAALKAVPDVNTQVDGTDLVYKHHYDIGVAVGTDRGLVVPVLRDVDTMSLAQIEKAITSLAGKAREGDLSIEDLQGGTFTISNGGIYGSLASTPILNAPQSGILGMHKIQERPHVVNGAVVIRPMMYLALSYDHRVIDGRGAVTFLVKVKEYIEEPQRVLLDL